MQSIIKPNPVTPMKKKILTITATLVVILTLICICTPKCNGEEPAAPSKDPYFDDFIPQIAQQAEAFAKQKGLNEKYCLLVDYALPSGQPRVFLWSFVDHKVQFAAHTMHGPGKGSTPQHAVLSNQSGSHCSAPGPFKVTKEHGHINSTGYFLSGLDSKNSNARERGLMLHGAYIVDLDLENNCEYLRLDALWCAGCVTISTDEMDYLGQIIESEPKCLLLWSFCSEQQALE